MHSFQKIVSDFGKFPHLYVHFKTFIGLHCVYSDQFSNGLFQKSHDGHSGVARIFSVGGHWGALGFRRGHYNFEPPPQKKKKKKKKNPHLNRVLIFRRNKLTSKQASKKKKKNHFCRDGQ